MKKFFLAIAALIASVAVYAQNNDILKVDSYTLPNGLQVWLNEDHTQPTAYGALVVKAGAKDCPGTGIAHYFEHMMFKGTDKIATSNYAAEKPYLDSIAVMYDKLAQTKEDSLRTEIQMEINRLNIAATKYAIPNEFSALVEECGGSNINAFTSQEETVYHSDFLPCYFEQWAELNSERVINPVFRLFQSELETVYEEKNMYSDNVISSGLEKMEAEFFKGSPYEAPVIGYTDNLKNPQLSQMAKFFEDYYVAGNMGLIITGDFDSAAAKPIIARTFGKIRPGTAPEKPAVELAPIEGRIDKNVEMNLPLVKLEMLCYRAPGKGSEDENALSILSYLLNNNEGVGLLDKLVVSGKVMDAETLFDSFTYQETGMFAVLIMPKLLFQSYKKAEKLVTSVFDDVKAGNFDDALFESCKLSYKKARLKDLEDHNSRWQTMAFALSAGKDWDEELANIEAVDKVTKEDVVRVANKYLNAGYYAFTKKSGLGEKDNLPKPPYENVVPESKDCVSAYAQAIRNSIAAVNVDIPELDYSTVKQAQISPLVKLYSAENPANDIFDLTFKFLVGNIECPAQTRLASYLNLLGTNEKSYDELYGELQRLGGSLSVASYANSFKLTITGFEENFDQTVALASTLLKDVKGDKKKLNSIKQEEKASLSMNNQEPSYIARALYSKVAFGEQSPMIADKGKFNDKYLLGLWKDIQKTQCDVIFTGNLPQEKVAEAVGKYLDTEAITVATKAPVDRNVTGYDKNQVYLIDMKDAAQTTVYAYIAADKFDTRYDRDVQNFFNSYLGGGMSSLMFQEIREFRSMAYSTGSASDRPSWKNRNDQNGYMIAVVGTQNDKAIDAMYVVDSLLNQTPFIPQKIENIKNSYYSDLFNSYPAFRGAAEYVEIDNLNDIYCDVKKEMAQNIKYLTPEDLAAYQKKHYLERPVVWCVVGKAEAIGLDKLEEFGPITTLKVSDVSRY